MCSCQARHRGHREGFLVGNASSSPHRDLEASSYPCLGQRILLLGHGILFLGCEIPQLASQDGRSCTYQGTCREEMPRKWGEMKVFFILHFIKSPHVVVIINKNRSHKTFLKQIFFESVGHHSFLSVGGLGLLKFLISLALQPSLPFFPY